MVGSAGFCARTNVTTNSNGKKKLKRLIEFQQQSNRADVSSKWSRLYHSRGGPASLHQSLQRSLKKMRRQPVDGGIKPAETAAAFRCEWRAAVPQTSRGDFDPQRLTLRAQPHSGRK